MIAYSYLTLKGEKIASSPLRVNRNEIVDTPMSIQTKWTITELANKYTPVSETTELYFHFKLDILPSPNFDKKGFLKEAKEQGLFI